MATKHDQLVNAAREAIQKIFSDISVPPATTRASLQELLEEIQMDLDALAGKE